MLVAGSSANNQDKKSIPRTADGDMRQFYWGSETPTLCCLFVPLINVNLMFCFEDLNTHWGHWKSAAQHHSHGKRKCHTLLCPAVSCADRHQALTSIGGAWTWSLRIHIHPGLVPSCVVGSVHMLCRYVTLKLISRCKATGLWCRRMIRHSNYGSPLL